MVKYYKKLYNYYDEIQQGLPFQLLLALRLSAIIDERLNPPILLPTIYLLYNPVDLLFVNINLIYL